MGMDNIANTGMKSAMSSMEVISNNIANTNTYGFKRSVANFSDLFPSTNGSAGLQTGLGVQVVSITQDFSTGGIAMTSGASDLSIGNSGFFIMHDPNSGQTSYTRAGSFTLDQNGYLTSGNNRLSGYPAANGTILAPSIVDLQVPMAAVGAQASTTVTGNLNLDANAAIPVTTTFNSNDPTSYNFATNTTIYDSLGNASQLSLYYCKTAPNTWAVNAQVGSASVGTGTLAFNTSGQLASTTGLNSLSYLPTNGALSPQPLSVVLTGSTQYGGGSSPQPFTQDGFTAGTYSGYSIDNSGILTVQYTNGQNNIAGQIAIAQFQSPEGLTNLGNMSWGQSSASGNPVITQNSSVGSINPGTLELSNVDLTQEMINLIGAQHSFQASAQVEQTFNEVMQTILKI